MSKIYVCDITLSFRWEKLLVTGYIFLMRTFIRRNFFSCFTYGLNLVSGRLGLRNKTHAAFKWINQIWKSAKWWKFHWVKSIKSTLVSNQLYRFRKVKYMQHKKKFYYSKSIETVLKNVHLYRLSRQIWKTVHTNVINAKWYMLIACGSEKACRSSFLL